MTSFYFYYNQNPFHLSFHTINPLLSPPEGLFISNTFEGEGGLFNLKKTMASTLRKELEYKVEKLKGKKVRGHAAEPFIEPIF